MQTFRNNLQAPSSRARSAKIEFSALNLIFDESKGRRIAPITVKFQGARAPATARGFELRKDRSEFLCPDTDGKDAARR